MSARCTSHHDPIAFEVQDGVVPADAAQQLTYVDGHPAEKT
jgi:hypothetical protein